jgi:CheY-like chemotaxis protein
MSTASPAAVAPSAAHALSEEKRQEFWAHVEEADPQAPWAAKRPPRLAYDRADVSIRATHPGGGSSTGTVYAHDLSAGGMSFLYQGYLHVGTTLALTLPRRLTGEDQHEGRVASCRHIGASWHAVGVKFNAPVALKLYVSPAELERLPAGNPIRPESLSGRVLMIDDQDMDRVLFAHMLRKTRLTVETVADVDLAVQSLRNLVADVVCLDLNLRAGKSFGEKAVQMIRTAGHRGPIVTISGEAPGRLAVPRGTEAEHMLAKPYNAEQLFAVLSAALDVGGTDPADLLYSEMANEEGCTELLRQFCDRVQQSMRDLRRNADAGRSDDVRHACQTLRGAAGGYGYPTVAAAAAAAVKTIDACGSAKEAAGELQRLAALCKRLTPDRKPPADG